MTLRRITLRNFVLVRELEFDCAEGFTALTGETGAGKSILIDALALALGGRAESSVVRDGQARADITASFDWPQHLAPTLADIGIEPDEALLLRRVVERGGGSRAWINGVPATAQQLRDLGSRLVDIHGQHAWQALTRPGLTRAVLDAFAGGSSGEVATAWHAWRKARHRVEQATTAQQQLSEESDRLAWQISEIDKLAPRDGEWDDLNESHRRLAHAQELIDGLQQALALLEGGDDASDGAILALSRAHAAVQAQAVLDSRLTAVAEQLLGARALIEDASRELHSSLANSEPDPVRLAGLDARLAEWIGLARRFRVAPQALPAFLQQCRQRAETLRTQADVQALQQAEQQARAHFEAAAQVLSQRRRAGAQRLAGAVSQVLPALGMPGGRFDVVLQTLEEPAAHGLEDIDFCFAAHAGSVLRPVARTASGGELSRLALAIAVCASANGSAETLIFDEIDAGIGGSTATTVGRLMRQLGAHRQVLAVTHMAQVAACGHHHARVSKRSDGRTDTPPESTLDALDGEARESELARMLGGVAPGSTGRPSEASRAHARELLHDGSRAADQAFTTVSS